MMSIEEFKSELEIIKHECNQSWYSALLSYKPHMYYGVIKSVNFQTFLKISYTLYKVASLDILNGGEVGEHLKSTIVLYPETIKLFNMDYNSFVVDCADDELEEQLYFAILEFELNRLHLLNDLDISMFSYNIKYFKNDSKTISKKELIERLNEYKVFYSSDLINVERLRMFIKETQEELYNK